MKEFLAVVAKEIEPLLKDAAPFFGGSSKVTLAEAITAPFIIRIYALAKSDVLPDSVFSGLNAFPNFSKWASEVIKQDSVLEIWDEQKIVEGSKKRFERIKAQAKV